MNTLTTSDTTPTISGTFDETDGTVTQVVVNGVTYLSSGSDLTVDNVWAGTWTLTLTTSDTTPTIPGAVEWFGSVTVDNVAAPTPTIPGAETG